jgi:hypothetical protein
MNISTTREEDIITTTLLTWEIEWYKTHIPEDFKPCIARLCRQALFCNRDRVIQYKKKFDDADFRGMDYSRQDMLSEADRGLLSKEELEYYDECGDHDSGEPEVCMLDHLVSLINPAIIEEIK